VFSNCAKVPLVVELVMDVLMKGSGRYDREAIMANLRLDFRVRKQEGD
jgi:hypothetical protein